MIGVTLSIGSVVVFAATNLFGLAGNSASLGASLQQSSAGVQLGLVYAAVPASGSCGAYQGFSEGTSLQVSLYNYGTVSFTPAEFVVNSTAYLGSYGAIGPGAMSLYSVSLGSCAHSSGQTILAYDSRGDEVQVGT